MELYQRVSYRLSQVLTSEYSTSFTLSSRLLDVSIRQDIYAIYGLVRIADEIVDSYRGNDQKELLVQLESEVYDALKRGYSVNPVVQAFASSARTYGIGEDLIHPFFESMQMDIGQSYTSEDYGAYIYGSAEVVGLMCLKVFCRGDEAMYRRLAPGARALGSAYQKVNFLRDMTHDYHELGRVYFPGVTYESFSEEQKRAIEADIREDFHTAQQAINELPKRARLAVHTSAAYYQELLALIEHASVDELKRRRIRVPNRRKLWLLGSRYMKERISP